MHALGYIGSDQYQQALEYPDRAGRYGFVPELDAPYVAEMARAWAIQRFGEDAYAAGYRIITTIDSMQQRSATRALRSGLLAYDRRHGFRGVAARLAPDELSDPTRLLAALNALPRAADLRAAVRRPDGKSVLAPTG